ncbi:hypothetical protein HRW14_28615 [Streptomyces lunaelactis]|uniref:hypothetical protein n=1 Tax=Streptomyces lunaelactis TaxID=1535768 RepID=UPI0015848427|nr:hypothetical protein [Streptomyces lunaelactis]NUK54163.1 hypothetical protein [Streptomyces lunaelactis]
MAINETVTGDDSVAITGKAAPGERTVGVSGNGDSVGVHGKGDRWHGVEGISTSTIGGCGVFGANSNGGSGVVGESKGRFNAGVYGKHTGTEGWGLLGEADNGTGAVGKSKSWVGLYGESQSVTGGSGVWGGHKRAGTGTIGFSATGVGGHGKGGRLAGLFEGDVEVNGKLRVAGTDAKQAISDLQGQIAATSDLKQQMTTLNQLVNNLQQQLSSLQQKQASDVEGIAVSLATLAARVTALGG